MTQNSNILQELKELNSSLAGVIPSMPYQLPAGYFDGLAATMLRRIKTMEATNVAEETNYISSSLEGISKQSPYTVPADYFETLPAKMLALAKTNKLSAEEEIETLSPLLSGLKKSNPFSVPEGYFETQQTLPADKQVKVIPMVRRKWFRYAVAAVLIGLIAITALIIKTTNTVDPNEDSYAWVKKKMKNVGTEKLDEFVQLVEGDNSVVASKPAEIKDLIKDVPESEIQSLLKDAEVLDDPELDDEALN